MPALNGEKLLLEAGSKYGLAPNWFHFVSVFHSFFITYLCKNQGALCFLWGFRVWYFQSELRPPEYAWTKCLRDIGIRSRIPLCWCHDCPSPIGSWHFSWSRMIAGSEIYQQVLQGYNIVADGWAGACNPPPHTLWNSYTQKQIKLPLNVMTPATFILMLIFNWKDPHF